MRQAQARKISDAYLDAPRRADRHLHVVDDDASVDPAPAERKLRFDDVAARFAEPATEHRRARVDEAATEHRRARVEETATEHPRARGAETATEHPRARVAGATIEQPKPRFADPAPRVVEDLRIEVPAVEIPDWAEPFADPRWDDDLGGKDYEERDGRKTVLVTGRPEGMAVPRREASAAPTARQRRHTPTRARLAGRPDRVALWAVALGLLMAAMAGFTGNGHAHGSHGSDLPAPAPLTSR